MNRPAQKSLERREPRADRRRRGGGFSFAEVLFAVMILGIGFIMIAAIFPVALVQSKLTQEETAGASIARGGANYIEQIAYEQTMPSTGGEVVSLGRMPHIQGKLMVGADPRLAWVPFYRRTAGSPYAQLYMIPTAVRNRSAYDRGLPAVVQSPLVGIPATPAGYIGTSILVADVNDSTNTPFEVDYIEFPSGSGANDTNGNYQTVAEGSYVIIANSPAVLASGQPARVGHIFRIGAPLEDAQQPAPGLPYPRRWSLVPGYDYVPKPGDYDNSGARENSNSVGLNENIGPLLLDNVGVFVVGRSLADPNLPASATNIREGTGQEVGAYVTFVQIR